MGCCASTPISASLADEILEIEHASYPNYNTSSMDTTRHPNSQITSFNK